MFISRWHTAASHHARSEMERARLVQLEESLADAVRGQRELAQLATTPLMCALMCALHRDRRGHLPQGRMELYEAALSMLLVRRDLERDIEAPDGVQLTEHQNIQLLQRLAYWLIRNGQTEMDQDTAFALLAEAQPTMPSVSAQGDAHQILAYLIGRSGLLRQPTADTIDFVRTFQDYLGAKACVEARDFGLLIRHAHDDQWEDVLRMAVAHARPTERATILRRLLTRGDRTARHRTRLHLLATACLENATELDPDVRQEVQNRTAALLPPRSYQEAEALASVGSVILDLLPGPDDLEDDEAQAVVRTAGLIGGAAALPLLKKYRDHTSFGVHGALMSHWERFDTRDYARDVLAYIEDDQISLVVRSLPELREVKHLRLQKPIWCGADVTAEDITGNLYTDRLEWLTLTSMPRIKTLDFLEQLPRLHNLSLISCPVHDLTPLTALQIADLTL
ncbi:NACHT domain-containing protein [Streptomyces sp. 8N706]|uniref:NACHT domain-containing protein n=1 Tax=Streptomyces sp. 8N706 TaxID=3457416 RepID=UPI003FD532E5